MDSTQVPHGNPAESNGVWREPCPVLHRAVWHNTSEFLYRRMPIAAKGRWSRLRLLAGTLFMAVLLLVLGGCAAAQNAVSPAPTLSEGGGAFVAALTPEGTNTHGTGTARLQLNPDHQTVCSVIHVASIELPATGAHIHVGAAGVKGPIVLNLQAPNAQGFSTGCTRAPRTLIDTIMQHPANYYVNVHNKSYPEGAVRGQLAACTPRVDC
jgi:hypothetical protein